MNASRLLPRFGAPRRPVLPPRGSRPFYGRRAARPRHRGSSRHCGEVAAADPRVLQDRLRIRTLPGDGHSRRRDDRQGDGPEQEGLVQADRSCPAAMDEGRRVRRRRLCFQPPGLGAGGRCVGGRRLQGEHVDVRGKGCPGLDPVDRRLREAEQRSRDALRDLEHRREGWSNDQRLRPRQGGARRQRDRSRRIPDGRQRRPRGGRFGRPGLLHDGRAGGKLQAHSVRRPERQETREVRS